MNRFSFGQEILPIRGAEKLPELTDTNGDDVMKEALRLWWK